MLHIGNKIGKIYIGSSKIGKVYIGSTLVYQSIIKVSVPTVSGSFTYNGSAQSPTISEYDSSIIQVSGNSATNAGEHTVTFHLKDTSKYCWEDSTTVDKTASWSIAQKEASLSWGTLTWLYDGSAHNTTCSVSNLISGDSCTVTLSGNSITSPGTTTVTATALSNGNYKLPADRSRTLTIMGAVASMPPVVVDKPATGSTVYIGYTPPAHVSVSGTTSTSTPGVYYAYYSVDAGWAWPDGTTGTKTTTFKVYYSIHFGPVYHPEYEYLTRYRVFKDLDSTMDAYISDLSEYGVPRWQTGYIDNFDHWHDVLEWANSDGSELPEYFMVSTSRPAPITFIARNGHEGAYIYVNGDLKSSNYGGTASYTFDWNCNGIDLRAQFEPSGEESWYSYVDMNITTY